MITAKMVFEDFKLKANEKNIYNAKDLEKCMLREIGPKIPKYSTILNLWNEKGSTKVSTLMLALHAIGLSKVTYK